MADVGSFGSFFGGFAEGFANAQDRRARREQSTLQRELQLLQLEQGERRLDLEERSQRALEAHRSQQQALEEKQFQLEQKKFGLTAMERFNQLMTTPMPDKTRVFLFDNIAKRMGIDTKSEQYKDARGAILSFKGEQAQGLAEAATALGLQGGPEQFLQFFRGTLTGQIDPFKAFDMLREFQGQQQIQQQRAELFDMGGGPAPQGNRLLSPTPLEQQPAEAGGQRPVMGIDEQGNQFALTPEHIPQLRRRQMQASRLGLDDEARQLGDIIESLQADREFSFEQQQVERKQAERQRQKMQAAQTVVQKVDEAISILNDSLAPNITAAGFGDFLKLIPTTKARDLSGALDTIRGNLGFDKLQQMRENSPTGGALGPVSDFENRLLQSTLASLDQGQSAEQLKKNLRRIRVIFEDIIHRGRIGEIGRMVERGVLTQEQAQKEIDRIVGGGTVPAPVEDPELERLLDKYGGE